MASISIDSRLSYPGGSIMSHSHEQEQPGVIATRTRTSDSTSSTSSLKPPRTPRFAEATSICSPIEISPSLLSEKIDAAAGQAHPADVGFGYINRDNGHGTKHVPPPLKSPLKSALKVPGTPGRKSQYLLSPTFREEQVLEQREAATEKEQAKDVQVKARVRMAKFALRSVHFACSLIILSMLSASFAIFNATKALSPKNGLPPWANNTKTWPQIVVLVASCITLVVCIVIFISYCRGGHRRAEKVGVYYTLFAVGWFIVSMVMWAVAAGVLQSSRNNSKNQDMWGWACVENHRADLFAEEVDYALVCRLQNWALICIIIEILIEVICISLYSFVFYRYYTKRRLFKSMDMRDKARSDLYLAQLRSQSAPNTPGFGPKSPSYSQYALSPRLPPQAYHSLSGIEENSPFTPGGQHLVDPAPQSSFTTTDKPFKLQPPPAKANPATPKPSGGLTGSPTSLSAPQSLVPEPAPMPPGEKVYEAVPIPGAYADAAVMSPPLHQTISGLKCPEQAATR